MEKSNDMELPNGSTPTFADPTAQSNGLHEETAPVLENGMNLDRFSRMEFAKPQQPPSRLGKSQQKKRAKHEPRPPPPKPTIPEGISVPESEESLIALWDLPDHELERRTNREKKRKAAE